MDQLANILFKIKLQLKKTCYIYIAYFALVDILPFYVQYALTVIFGLISLVMMVIDPLIKYFYDKDYLAAIINKLPAFMQASDPEEAPATPAVAGTEEGYLSKSISFAKKYVFGFVSFVPLFFMFLTNLVRLHYHYRGIESLGSANYLSSEHVTVEELEKEVEEIIEDPVATLSSQMNEHDHETSSAGDIISSINDKISGENVPNPDSSAFSVQAGFVVALLAILI